MNRISTAQKIHAWHAWALAEGSHQRAHSKYMLVNRRGQGLSAPESTASCCRIHKTCRTAQFAPQNIPCARIISKMHASMAYDQIYTSVAIRSVSWSNSHHSILLCKSSLRLPCLCLQKRVPADHLDCIHSFISRTGHNSATAFLDSGNLQFLEIVKKSSVIASLPDHLKRLRLGHQIGPFQNQLHPHPGMMQWKVIYNLQVWTKLTSAKECYISTSTSSWHDAAERNLLLETNRELRSWRASCESPDNQSLRLSCIELATARAVCTMSQVCCEKERWLPL